MNCDQAVEHLKTLKCLKKLYLRLYNDPYKSVYGDQDLSELIHKTNEQIEELIDIMFNMELDDSYDPNTGKVHSIYKTNNNGKLLKF